MEDERCVAPSPRSVRVKCEPVEDDKPRSTEDADVFKYWENIGYKLKEEMEEVVKDVKPLFYGSEEFPEQNNQRLHTKCSELSCSSPIDPLPTQSFKAEMAAMNEGIHFPKIFPSERDTVVLQSLEYQTPFSAASCSTADDTMDEEKAADILKEYTEQPIAEERQKQQSDESEGRICKDQEARVQRRTPQSGSLRNPADQRRFKCCQCGKTLKTKGILKKHMRIHTGERPYRCSCCGKSFTQSGHLAVHMRTHTGHHPYKCPQCGRSFTQGTNLNVHMYGHTGQRPYKCSLCGMSFKQSCILTRHMRTHTGDRPYKCCHCGKSFITSGHLTEHLRTHTGERPYRCPQCGKSFKKNSHLVAHVHNHTAERPHKCLRCGESFKAGSTLTKHMFQHTENRPFKCLLCGKSFKQSSNLTIHMRVHT